MNITRVGVDIAKSVFHVHAVDRHDHTQWHANLKRSDIGTMIVKSKDALANASYRHMVFSKAWAALKECDADREWVAIVDLPD